MGSLGQIILTFFFDAFVAYQKSIFSKAGTPLTAASLRSAQSSFRCIRQPQQKQSKELSFFSIF